MSSLQRRFSRLASLPGFSLLSPAAPATQTAEHLKGYFACQSLAFRAAREVADHLREGWTESQTADLMNTYLQDCGVRGFFHRAFVWFGDRTRFDGVGSYAQFSPGDRVLRPGDAYILDVAPILKGYICDIGYSGSLGPNPDVDKARAFLKELRREIPKLFDKNTSGERVCRAVHEMIVAKGYANIHHKYPFSVLGHRVHHSVGEGLKGGALNFGWQSYWELLSRGLFGQLLNENYHGKLDGLWAVEPHIGGTGFGAKFEEILVVENGSARWLDSVGAW